MEAKLFDFLPEALRPEQIKRVKQSCNCAIKFPAAYFTKIRSGKDGEGKRIDYDLLWINCCQMDNNGMVIKAAPDFIIKNARKVLDRYGQEYEVIEL